MTWKVLVLAFVLIGCMPGRPSGKEAPRAPRCADLVAHAMTTQAPQPVVGAYDCLEASIQLQAQLVGISDDATWAQYATAAPVYTAYRYVGKSAGRPDTVYYYFTLTPLPCYRISLNAQGLVDGGSFSRTAAACPTPLP